MHGQTGLEAAENASQALFGGDVTGLHRTRSKISLRMFLRSNAAPVV
jgi:hypothetical protein